MFIDSRYLLADSTVQAAVCIVGAGPAGLTIAFELARQGIAVNVFESGPMQLHEATANLNEGLSVGLPYQFGHGQRSRYLGGGSNCWGGFCRPWDPWDFAPRDWVENSGWPVNLDTLNPYYRRAHDLLQVQSTNYDPAAWDEAADGRIKRIRLDSTEAREVMTLFSPPLNFRRAYRDDLAASKLISVYLWANAAHVDTEPLSGKVSRIEFRTLSGNRFFAIANQFVLAAGGIENPRILLNSNRQQANGVGNRHDVVGRYFMDHPRLMSAAIELTPEFRHVPFYDAKYFCISDKFVVNGVKISGQFTLPFEVQRREELLNSQLWLRSLYPAETSECVQSLWRMRLRAARRYSLTHRLGHDLWQLARHPLSVGLFAAAHISASRAMVRKVVIESIVEPEPIADSRVTLSGEFDALGLRRAAIDWRLTERAKRTFDRGFHILGEQLIKAGVAVSAPNSKIEGQPWPGDLAGTWHHMGATRMHDSPRKGVVDRDCRVHGVANLFVAGSSVFPTGSSNYPTITLVALALRLAERLSSEQRVLVLGDRGSKTSGDGELSEIGHMSSASAR